MDISSRTPEGTPNRCPLCGTHLRIEPSSPPDFSVPCLAAALGSVLGLRCLLPSVEGLFAPRMTSLKIP